MLSQIKGMEIYFCFANITNVILAKQKKNLKHNSTNIKKILYTMKVNEHLENMHHKWTQNKKKIEDTIFILH